MDTVDRECRKTGRVAPEEYLVVDVARLIGDLLSGLLRHVHEKENHICRYRREQNEERVYERCRRHLADDEISYDAAARCSHYREYINAEDIHLLADARDSSGHRKSNGADDVCDQDEERRVHTAIIAE